MIGGGLWFWSGYAAFAIFYSLLGWNWLVSKILGDTIGWVINYVVQRYWAFNDPRLSRDNVGLSLRYGSLMLIHILLDYLIVSGLYYLGITPYIGAFAAAGVLTIWNYFWFRFFVFKPKD